MGRLIVSCVITLMISCTFLGLPGCGDSSKPKKKESQPPKKAERPRPRPVTPVKRSSPKVKKPEEMKPEEMTPEARVAKYIEMLGSSRSSKRKTALNYLAILKDEKLAASAIKPIQKKLTDPKADVRALAGIALLKLKGKEGSHYIRPLLKDSSEEVRASVLDELGKLGKDFAHEMMNGLEDPSPAIQEIVLDHLSRLKYRQADGLAIQLFKRTEEERLRSQILAYLIQIKSKKGTAAVEKHIDDLENAIPLTLAVRYLGLYGNLNQAKKCTEFLNDREIGVRKEAAGVMAKRKIKTQDSISGLINLLRDDEFEVRRVALKSLKELTNQNFPFDPEEEDEKKLEATLKKWEEWLDRNASKFPEN